MSAARLVIVWGVLVRRRSVLAILGLLGCSLVLFGGVAALSFVEMSLRDTYRHELALGANVLVVRSEASGVDRAECTRLAARSDVLAVGAIGAPVLRDVAVAPGSGMLVSQIDIGAVSVLDPSFRDSRHDQGVLLGREAARYAGASPGSILTLGPVDHLRVHAVIDSELRAPEMNRWIFSVTAPTGIAAECWIEAAEGSRDELEESVRAGLTARDTTISSLRPEPPERAIDAGMVTVWGALPWIWLTLVGLIAVSRRVYSRAEIALLHILGLDWVQVALLRAMSAAVLYGFAALIAVAGAVVLEHAAELQLSRYALLILTCAGLFGIAAEAVLGTLRPRNPLLTLRDRT